MLKACFDVAKMILELELIKFVFNKLLRKSVCATGQCIEHVELPCYNLYKTGLELT